MRNCRSGGIGIRSIEIIFARGALAATHARVDDAVCIQ